MPNWIVDVECNEGQNKNCPIQLGQVTCDGFKECKSIGVFSHFHEDHIHAITDCIGSYDTLITHPITFEAIIAMDPGIALREQWVTQNYDTVYKTPSADIRLLKANHIPGSAQVHVETNGLSLLYSGDFNYPEMQIKKADYLVLDATHGDPWYDGKTDRKSVKNRMFEDVKEKIGSNKPVIIQTYAGTLQELIRHFEIGYDGDKLSHDIPFVTETNQKEILLKIYKDEKNEFREIIDYNSRDFWKLVRNNKRCVIFLTSEIIDSSLQSYYKIIVDKYRFVKEKAAIIPFDGGCRYNLASHASIDNILSYVKEVKPKQVVTDYSRSGYAPILAKLINQKFPEIETYPRPPKK